MGHVDCLAGGAAGADRLRAFSETDFRPDLKAVPVPTLIVYATGYSPIS